MAKWPKPAEGSWTEHYPELGTAPVSYEDSVSPEFFEAEREAVVQAGLAERRPQSNNCRALVATSPSRSTRPGRR